MRQKCWFIDSTCFGHKHAHRQEYNSEFSFFVSKPGKPPGLCSAGLLDVCTVQRMWPRPLNGTGLDTKKRNSLLYSWRWTYLCPKHVESINQHFCPIYLVFILHNIYDARSHEHQSKHIVYSYCPSNVSTYYRLNSTLPCSSIYCCVFGQLCSDF
jgi:hypothetical protein